MLAVLIGKVIIELFFVIFYQLPFNISKEDVFKCLKVGSVTGYRAISPLYAPGEVDKTRDPHTPFRFVESLYGIGEWRGLHRITDLRQLLWGYHQEGDNYLCRCALPASVDTYLLNDEE